MIHFEKLLDDDRIDLITSFVTFHHLSRLEPTLKELTRILRKDGYLIIREHDCDNSFSLPTKYLNFVHAIMMIGQVGEFSAASKQSSSAFERKRLDWPSQKQEILKYMKTINYRTKEEWNEQMKRFGLEFCSGFTYGTTSSDNPQGLFYAVYQMKTKG